MLKLTLALMLCKLEARALNESINQGTLSTEAHLARAGPTQVN